MIGFSIMLVVLGIGFIISLYFVFAGNNKNNNKPNDKFITNNFLKNAIIRYLITEKSNHQYYAYKKLVIFTNKIDNINLGNGTDNKNSQVELIWALPMIDFNIFNSTDPTDPTTITLININKLTKENDYSDTTLQIAMKNAGFSLTPKCRSCTV